MEQMTGATFMYNALNAAYNDMWVLADDPTRNKIMIFVTDGEPTIGQDPCPIAPTYNDDEIFILAVVKKLFFCNFL